MTLKWMVYPASVISLGFTVFNHNSKIRFFLFPKIRRIPKNKLAILLLEFGFIILAPAFIIYLSYGYLALTGKYVAKKTFSETVLVKEVSCYRRTKYTNPNVRLDIITADNQQTFASFNYRLCEQYPYLHRLEGQTITLYGRKWALGTVYMGISYPPNINLKE